MSSEVNVTQGNKLIAIFDGWKFTPLEDQGLIMVSGSCYFKDTPDEVDKFCSEKLKYHTSWYWLMPVVEKIEREHTDFELTIYSASCYISKWNPDKKKYESFISGVGKKIDAVYDAVIQFITWYNNNSTQ